MADTTIKATVTGEDKTAATFDRIANRIDNLAKKSDQAFDGMSIRQERGIAHGIEALMSGNALSGGYGLMHGLHDMVSASVGGGIMAGLAGFAVGGALENHLHLGEKLFDKIFGDPQIFLNTLD